MLTVKNSRKPSMVFATSHGTMFVSAKAADSVFLTVKAAIINRIYIRRIAAHKTGLVQFFEGRQTEPISTSP